MTYPFHVLVDGRTVAEACEVSGLESKPPGPVTLKRTIVRDPDFVKAMGASWRDGARGRDMRIALHDEEGRVVAAFSLAAAWVSQWVGPVLGQQAAFESITLENSGCHRLA